MSDFCSVFLIDRSHFDWFHFDVNDNNVCFDIPLTNVNCIKLEKKFLITKRSSFVRDIKKKLSLTFC